MVVVSKSKIIKALNDMDEILTYNPYLELSSVYVGMHLGEGLILDFQAYQYRDYWRYKHLFNIEKTNFRLSTLFRRYYARIPLNIKKYGEPRLDLIAKDMGYNLEVYLRQKRFDTMYVDE